MRVFKIEQIPILASAASALTIFNEILLRLAMQLTPAS
jgi:hypothetical protein